MSIFDPEDDRIPQHQIGVDLERDWQEDGTCFDRGSDVATMFFSNLKSQQAEALLYCAECPVKSLCYAYSLIYGERGIWGGTTDKERDERRPFVVDDVLRMWPRLYMRWLSTAPVVVYECSEAPEAGSAPSPVADRTRLAIIERALEAEGKSARNVVDAEKFFFRPDVTNWSDDA